MNDKADCWSGLSDVRIARIKEGRKAFWRYETDAWKNNCKEDFVNVITSIKAKAAMLGISIDSLLKEVDPIGKIGTKERERLIKELITGMIKILSAENPIKIKKASYNIVEDERGIQYLLKDDYTARVNRVTVTIQIVFEKDGKEEKLRVEEKTAFKCRLGSDGSLLVTTTNLHEMLAKLTSEICVQYRQRKSNTSINETGTFKRIGRQITFNKDQLYTVVEYSRDRDYYDEVERVLSEIME